MAAARFKIVSACPQDLKGPCHCHDLAVDHARHRAQLALCLTKRGDNFRFGSNTHRDLSGVGANVRSKLLIGRPRGIQLKEG